MLSCEAVSVAYGPVRALHGVTLEVQEHEVVAVVGANGAGKSTLLRAIMGLVRVQRGRILFCGRDLLGRRPYEITRLGVALVPEGRRVFAGLTVEETLDLGGVTLAPAARRERLAEAAAGGSPLGGGAAEAGHRPRPHFGPAAPPRGRALTRALPPHGAPGGGGHRRHPGPGDDDPAGRAERPAGPAARVAGLRPPGGPGRPGGRQPRPPHEPGREEGVPRRLGGVKGGRRCPQCPLTTRPRGPSRRPWSSWAPGGRRPSLSRGGRAWCRF